MSRKELRTRCSIESDDSINQDGYKRMSKSSLSDSISLYSMTSVTSEDGVTDCAPQGAPVIKEGWLEKTPPKGAPRYQKRWVTLDVEYLKYFKNEKVRYSKRIIPVTSITNVVSTGDQKFEAVTRNRTFVFRAASHLERNEWVSALQETCGHRSTGDTTSHPSIHMQGYLEVRGFPKLYVVVDGSKVFLYDNEEEFKTGVGITSIEMNLGSVKDVDRRAFDLITPYKTFHFVAETDQLKEEWMAVMRSCITDSLSHNDVAMRVWSEESNKSCADCGADEPKWAAINLCVVLCQLCAAAHRGLGSSISKIRSLNMDKRVWTDELIQLFLSVGNKRANLFWAVNVPPGASLSPSSSNEERQQFISAKYLEGRYRCYHRLFGHQEALNNALCANLKTDDVLETLSLVFCGADVNCETGFSEFPSPISLASHYNQPLQVVFLYHNQNIDVPSPEGICHRTPLLTLPTLKRSGYLFKTGSMERPITVHRSRDDFSQRWCSLDEEKFSYYENDRSSKPKGELKTKDIACLAVNPPGKHGYAHTFEMYITSGRLYLFGADDPQTVREWIESITKAFISSSAEDLVGMDFERIGRLRYRLNLQSPKMGWFALVGSMLHGRFQGGNRVDMDLHRLQELSTQQENAVLVLVERGRTLHIESEQKIDFLGWSAAIQQSAQSTGNTLSQQQLTCLDVPVIVDRCIKFITQYGLMSEGLYRKNGVNSKISALLEEFRRDARGVRLQEEEHGVDNVSGVLKRFFRVMEDCVFTSEALLHWLSTTAVRDEGQKISQYQSLLRSLPPVNKATLEALMNHLYCVQHFEDMNQMNQHNLAVVFGPSLFQTDGRDCRASRVIEELIGHYVAIFDVNEEQLQKQLEVLRRFSEMQDSCVLEPKPLPPSHIICTVILEENQKKAEYHIQVSDAMTAAELVREMLDQSKISVRENEYWSCFEVNEKEETERSLHYQERVLSVFLCLGMDSNVLVKKHPSMRAMLLYLVNEENISKCGVMKFRDDRSLLGRGNFHDRFMVLNGTSLRLFKEVQSNRAEKEWPVKTLRIYQGIKARLRPPTSWGMTVVYEDDKHENQRWYMCCETQIDMIQWLATFLCIKHEGNLWPLEFEKDG
ncbi:hypothetical protein MATL_G00048550 [Megalops atlanticus]|uniref:ArfGAP with RhoGAP domain, ankyrin repeat and PH domain 1 n=1 Tax=Megalops atlanticus TaxID=7932 RepID=A0A9D3TIT3_MEGAT|nr:hypothetical protein MATL_G00048550 [Megalops atlanticus]